MGVVLSLCKSLLRMRSTEMKSICMNYFYGLMEPQLALSKRWTAIGRYLPVVCYVAAVVVTTVVHCGIFMPA